MQEQIYMSTHYPLITGGILLSDKFPVTRAAITTQVMLLDCGVTCVIGHVSDAMLRQGSSLVVPFLEHLPS